MDPEQALELLGLTGHEDGKTARRAYLRLLKQHKPDRDPEGFKRIRQAYEAIDGLMPWHDGDGDGEHGAAGAESAPATAPQPPVRDALQEQVRDPAQDGGRFDEDDHDDGDDDLDEDYEPDPLWEDLNRIEEGLTAGRPQEVAPLLEQHVQAATGAEPWQARSLLQLCAGLIAAGEVTHGQRLLADMLARVSRSGSELALSEWNPVELMAMKELVALPDAIDAELRGHLARALDSDEGKSQVRIHLVASGKRGKKLRKLLKKHAPILHALAELEPGGSAHVETDEVALLFGRDHFPWAGVGVLAVWGLLQIFRACAG